jgi:hypothetical protein
MKALNKSYYLIIVLSLVWTSCATNKVTSESFAGTYNWKITTDDGDMSGNIVLAKSGEAYTGTITSDQGSQDLTNLKIEGNNITANLNYMGYDVVMKGVVSDHDINGSFSTQGYSFPFDAIKQK